MRLRFLLGVCVAAGLVLSASFYLKSRLGVAPRQAGPERPRAAAAGTPAVPAPTAAGPGVARAPDSPEDREKVTESEVERLRELSLSDDPASLNEILLALTSPEKEIREAAVEGAKQFGSTNAIPALLAAADAAADPREKINLLEAVEFLSLPPATFAPGPISLTPEQAQAEEERRALRRLRRQARDPERSGLALEPAALPPAPAAEP